MSRIILVVMLVGLSSCENSTNWRDKGIVGQVRSMGSCFCTWAFAAANIYESWYLQQNYSNSDISSTSIEFSAQFILQCSSMGDCSGGSLAGGLAYAVQYGVPSEADFQYTGRTTSYGVPQTSSEATCSNVTKNRVNKTAYVNQYGNISIAQMKTLLGNTVVGADLAPDTDFYTYAKSDPYECTTTIKSEHQLTFSVSVIGYDNSSNLVIQTSGMPTIGGTVYDNDTSTGEGFIKLGSNNSYCGALLKPVQVWYNSSSNNNNKSSTVLIVANIFLLATFLAY